MWPTLCGCDNSGLPRRPTPEERWGASSFLNKGNMTDEQLKAIEVRAVKAATDAKQKRVNPMFLTHALSDVVALLAEVQRLRQQAAPLSKVG